MPVYMISVICAAALIGIIVSLIFYRRKIYDFRTAAAITLASLVTALVMPGVLSLIFSAGKGTQDPLMHVILSLVSIVVYLILVFMLTVAIVYLLPRIKTRHNTQTSSDTAADGLAAAAALQPGADIAATAADVMPPVYTQQTDNTGAQDAESISTGSAAPAGSASEEDTVFTQENGNVSAGENTNDGDLDMGQGNYIEDIFLKFVGRDDNNLETIANNEEIQKFEEDGVEKSVDSSENTDKMGIESNMHDGGNMTIEECINEAYRLREAGDAEGSVLYYMYALDRKPHKELAFWIVLDICVLYKSLGQQDLALEILNGYYDIYGDEMDTSVKETIVRNLTDIGA
jgi:hypothetical protein